MSQLTEAQKQLKKVQQENLKAAFETLWQQLGGPELTPEYKFHPVRNWKVDYFHPAGVVIEIEGGTHVKGGGRHNRAEGYTEDCIKYNALNLMGLKLFRLTSDMLTQREGPAHLQPIIELMRRMP